MAVSLPRNLPTAPSTAPKRVVVETKFHAGAEIRRTHEDAERCARSQELTVEMQRALSPITSHDAVVNHIPVHGVFSTRGRDIANILELAEALGLIRMIRIDPFEDEKTRG